jgi:hypothetical protein
MEKRKKKSDSFDKLNDSSMKNSSMKDENKPKNSKLELNQSELKVTQITMQEIWAATKPIVHKNKKTYTRKGKKDDNKLDDI